VSVSCGDKDDDGCGSKSSLVGSTESWTTGANPDAGIGLGSGGGGGSSGDKDCAGGSYRKLESDSASGAMPPSSGAAEEPASVDASAPGGMIGSGGGSGNGQVEWGILTAGTFDDALNSEHFAKYWAEVLTPDPYGSEDPSQLQWPKFEDLPTGERFDGVAKTALDLSFVVDVTGSMGDELAYINAELGHIVGAVKDRYGDVTQRWSLIVYRDEGDEYVTKGINFTGDLDEFKVFLAAQQAGGGGDMPEAMHTALEEADSRLQWGDATTAKVMFLIADAPPHVQHVPATMAALDELTAKGVHVYPVASSGVDPLAEKIMRYGAVSSRGEYLFLTDDSGVGAPHAEPHVPCYAVRKLADVMIETLVAEIQGARVSPDPATIIRTVGNPVDGMCAPQ
jgi:hypothetical protein